MGKGCEVKGNNKAWARGRKVLENLREWPMNQIKVRLPVGAAEK